MPKHGRSERKSQKCVIALVMDPVRSDYLGYRYFGEWTKQESNCGIEPAPLRWGRA